MERHAIECLQLEIQVEGTIDRGGSSFEGAVRARRRLQFGYIGKVTCRIRILRTKTCPYVGPLVQIWGIAVDT